jgi:cell division transport system permease protein
MLGGRRDLLLSRDPSVRFLPLLVAFMVYLAALAIAGALVAHKVISRWETGLAGQITVQIPAPPSGYNTAQGDRVAQAVRFLEAAPGVRTAKALSDDDLAALLDPWLGLDQLTPDLPLPSLIAVTLDDQDRPDLETLGRRLDDVVPGAILDTHERWLDQLLRLARSVEMMAVLVVVLIAAAAVVTVVFVTRTGLSVHHHVIEVLNLIGAQDSYVAQQFQSHALWLGLRGGTLGSVLAVATLFAIYALVVRRTELLPDIEFTPVDWGVMAAVPVVVAVTAMVTARVTVLRTLSRMS